MSHTISCMEAKHQDLVTYLASLGHEPKRVKGDDYWYLSPLREETAPSFKVNKKFNVWYDHGMGRGGNLIDFGVLYHRCTVKELLERLHTYSSFQQPSSGPSLHSVPNAVAGEESKIRVLSASNIESSALIEYLNSRKISLDIAQEHCRQAVFQLYGKQITAIGFPNRSGGYELRNAHFKGGSSPKDITFFDQQTDEIIVFEGFFNYLSFQLINQNKQAPLTNRRVLNSLAFLEKSRPLMEQYKRIHLALDRDTAGINATQKALQWDPAKYIDRSDFYQSHIDLNEWLQHQNGPFQVHHERRMGRSR